MTDSGTAKTVCSPPALVVEGNRNVLGLRVGRQPINRLEQLIDERVPAHLAVGDDIQSRALLHRDHLVDGAIFDLLERRRVELAGLVLRTGAQQVFGTQQRPTVSAR